MISKPKNPTPSPSLSPSQQPVTSCDTKIEQQEDIQNNSQDHQIDDEQLDKLLDDDNQSKEEIVLRFKVNQLQKICNSLTSTNVKLIEKVTFLEQERDKYVGKGREVGNEDGDGEQAERSYVLGESKDGKDEMFVDQYSQLNNQFTDIEQLIQEYKTSLEQFQKNVLIDIKSKQQKIVKIKQEKKDLHQKYRVSQQQKQDIQKLNKQLQTRNQGLILQIQNLQKQKSKLQQKLSQQSQPFPQPYPYYPYNYTNPQHQSISTTRYNSHQHLHSNNNNNNEYELPIDIQNQYQILIEKLVKELQYEKNMKKKMNQEIKRMSQELMESQRQIMKMKLLRSSKTTADSSINYSKFKNEDIKLHFNHRQDNQPKHTSNSNSNSNSNGAKADRIDQKLNMKSFVLLQLINGELDQEVSNAERKVIGLKIIEFYERKMQREDYSNVNPQNLLVCNFNHRKCDLISIKKVGTSAYEEGEKTQQSLVWNLAFILDNLFGQNQGVEDFDEILEITGQILEKQFENNKETVQCMKEILYL